MLRFAASFFTSNTKPTNTTATSNDHDENSQETTVCVNSTKPAITVAENSNISNEPTFEEEERFDDEDIVLIQSLRKQKQQELAQKVLLRRISHQAVMNHYAQDHLPLSQLQEKLEEDNLPLLVLQEKLKQRDDLSIYTTIKENINFLLYSKPFKLNRSKESGETVNSNAPTKNYRDYDVWDDAIIGRLMNLIDTIGMETEEITPKVENELVKEITKEIMKEVVKEVVKEESVNESSVFSEESVEDTAEENKETIVAVAADDDNDDNNDDGNDDDDGDDDGNDDNDDDDDDDDDDNNGDDDAVENIQKETKNESIKIAEEIINFGETINVAESLLLTKRSNNLTRPQSEILTTSKNKRRSILSFPSSSNNRNSISIPKSLKRNVSNLNRRNSIHSKKSYENDISRSSSISSNFSVNNNTTDVIIEELNEDDSDNTKFRNKFFTTTKKAVSTQRSNKSLQFLRNLWKHNQNLPSLSDSDELNKEIKERQHDSVKSDHELNHLANFQRGRVGESIGTVGVPDYSNFYLSMPNGKWMVRTRTGSKKITGTQYVNKEFI